MRGILLAATAVLAGSACASAPDKGAIERGPGSTRATLGSFDSAVSVVVERRCGSLDCHGSAGRNLRIYSANGARLPNDGGLRPGSGDTTVAERTASYHSILGLEPERTAELLAGGEPYGLLFMRKPLALEKHGGGQAIRRGDDAERCLVSWLKESATVPLDTDACKLAAIFPKP